MTAGLPHQDDGDDAGSSFVPSEADAGEADEEWGSEWEEDLGSGSVTGDQSAAATSETAKKDPKPIDDHVKEEIGKPPKEEDMEKLEPLVEAAEEADSLPPSRRQSTAVGQIPALVRIPLCPPPIEPPPPLPEAEADEDRALDMSRAVLARRRSSAAAATTARRESASSTGASEDKPDTISELVKKSAEVLSQLLTVKDDEEKEQASAEEDKAGVETMDQNLSTLDVTVIVSAVDTPEPEPAELEDEVEEEEDNSQLEQDAVTDASDLSGIESDQNTKPATSAPPPPTNRKRLKAPNAARKKKSSTLASQWRRQRERERSREASPAPFGVVMQTAAAVESTP